jgi:hypothetical protein
MQEDNMNIRLIKQPLALLPIVMSLAAIAMVLSHAAIGGVVHETDEGTLAHVFQLLMVAQVPIVALFVALWLPRQPGQTLRVVALQVALGLIAIALAYWLT